MNGPNPFSGLLLRGLVGLLLSGGAIQGYELVVVLLATLGSPVHARWPMLTAPAAYTLLHTPLGHTHATAMSGGPPPDTLRLLRRPSTSAATTPPPRSRGEEC